MGKLCENRQLIVNLIPYNQTDVRDKLHCPSEQRMQEFRDIVASYGTFCTIRRTMGADIASACGQLVTKKKKAEKENLSMTLDIEDVIKDRTTRKREANGSARAAVRPKATTNANSSQVPASKNNNNNNKNVSSVANLQSYMESIPDESLERWMQYLTVASSVAASCFVISSYFFFRKR